MNTRGGVLQDAMALASVRVASTRLRLDGRELLNFSSNDYLGLAQHPALAEAAVKAVERFGTGSGASRLVCGSLAVHHELEEALAAFKKSNINLTWIESFPLRGPEAGYVFFIDFEGHAADAKTRKTLDELQHKAVRLEVLGSYPRSAPID